ncbi:hypothetical protein SESBI_20257 [Sesbania bispinosa]|nr:hypothetical protein SESBI_20257 [Sesbania bispinosa]
MDKFYSCCGASEMARDRRRKELEKRKMKMKTELQPKPNWVPSFEWGRIFTNDVEFRRSPLIFPTPISNHTCHR